MKSFCSCNPDKRYTRLANLARCMGIGLSLIVVQPVASGADTARGGALYENHCIVCHTSKVHRREPRVAADAAQLRAIVDRWQAEQGLRWTREDIDDVVEYLALTQYKY